MPYDLKTLTAWCVGLSWLYIGCNVLLAATIVAMPDAVLDALASEDFGLDGSPALFMAVVMLFLVYAVAGLACYIASAVWIYRASANARAIDPDPERIAPGWAIGWFCIPIANLWMPFRAIKQCWNSSMHGPGALARAAPGFFALWWAAWILADVLSGISYRLSSAPDPASQLSSLRLDAAGSVVVIVSALCWIRILQDIAAAQGDQSAMSDVFV